MREIPSIVAGTNFDGRAQIIRARCKVGSKIELVREPDNKFDPNAIAVYLHGKRLFGMVETREQIGYIKAGRAEGLAEKIDSGAITVVGAFVKSFHAPPEEHVPRVSLTIQLQSKDDSDA